MKSIVLGLICFVFVGYVCAAILLYVFQRNFLYFPTEQIDHPFEQITVLNQGEKLEVIVLNKGMTNALIYFGGNGATIALNAQNLAPHLTGVTAYFVNYRGYGGSSGKPTEAGLYADALAVYDHIQDQHGSISVAGRSLGSGVATYLAANRPIISAILIAPYDSLLNVAKAKFAFFPIKLLLKDHYDSFSRAKDIKASVTVIAAEHDNVIPMSHTQRLIDAFETSQVIVKMIDGVGHNSLSNSSDYMNAFNEAIERYE